VLDGLNRHGKGYQTRINRILRGGGESAVAVGSSVRLFLSLSFSGNVSSVPGFIP